MIRRLFSLCLLAALPAAHAAECKVTDAALQGSYSGPCVNGLAEGAGEAQGYARYKGEFHAGQKHGRGEQTWPNGDRYVGEFQNDLRHGRGTYTWGKGPLFGQRYEGEFKNNLRDGEGTFSWPWGDQYTGPWSKDAPTGQPTAMMLLNAHSTLAALKVLAKPGLEICRVHREGLAAKTTLERAKVISQQGDALEIEVAQSSATSTPAHMIVSPLGWHPCAAGSVASN